jgi:uncharacterized membrane protein YtjA (UPF0391 family)
MLGWAIGFFIAALVAAVFGFGGIASAFTGIAILMFWVFIALFVLSLLFGVFGGAHGPDGHGGGRSFALLAVIAVVGLLVYAWADNDWSAERAGRVIDREAAQLAESSSEALRDAGDRAESLVDDASREIRNDASDGLDEASDNVDPEEEEAE